MPQPYTADVDEHSTGTAPFSNSNSDSSFMQSKFDSLIGFHQWLVKDKSKHANNGFAGATAATVGSGEAAMKKNYTMEDISSSPLRGRRRFRNQIDDEGSPQPTRKFRRGCSGSRTTGCRRRKRSSSQDAYPSPEYFEPWVWKGTTRRPNGRRRAASPQVGDDDDEGGSGTFIFFIVVVVIIICVVVLVKNKDKVQDLLKFSGRYFGGSDIANVKGRVVGDVKDMIDTNFDDMSWKYNDQPQELDDDEAFGNAVEKNDPSVIRHIRSFEDQLRKKPSQFFPGEGGGGRKKYSSVWSSVKNM